MDEKRTPKDGPSKAAVRVLPDGRVVITPPAPAYNVQADLKAILRLAELVVRSGDSNITTIQLVVSAADAFARTLACAHAGHRHVAKDLRKIRDAVGTASGYMKARELCGTYLSTSAGKRRPDRLLHHLFCQVDTAFAELSVGDVALHVKDATDASDLAARLIVRANAISPKNSVKHESDKQYEKRIRHALAVALSKTKKKRIAERRGKALKI